MSTKTDILIDVKNVSKVFSMGGFMRDMALQRMLGRSTQSGYAALNEVSFEAYRGETIGILGSNGAGKSTLLQLITGTMQPSGGNITVDGSISALLELGAGFNLEWTGRRNAEFYCIVQGVSPAELSSRIKAVEDFADIGDFFDRPMRVYSSGMFLRVAFAAAIAVDPDIIIIDEALAVGDARFQNKCFSHFKKMQNAGKTILFVTHDTVTMSHFCTRGIVLQKGEIVHDGDPDNAVKIYRKILFSGKPVSEGETEQDEIEDGAVNTAVTVTGINDYFPWPIVPELLKTRSHYNKQEESAGVGVGQILDVELLGDDKKLENSIIQKSQKLSIIFQIAPDQYVGRPCYGIVLKNKENVSIYGITNIMLGNEMPPVRKGEIITVSFDIDTRLAGGDYFIDLGFSEMINDELSVIEWRMSVACFSVQTNVDFYGFVDLDAEFKYGEKQSLGD